MSARGTDGLTGAEAERRLAEFGPNILPGGGTRNVLSVLLGVLREPMFALLLAAATIYIVLGDLAEGSLLLFAAVAGIGLGVAQERRTERALAALRDLSSPRALVLREGKPTRIAGRGVVPGDVLILAEGDRIAADGRLVEAEDFQVDESLLTGESVPVERVAAVDAGESSVVHAGSLVVRGHGRAVVTATGTATAFGRIGVSLAGVEAEETPLRRRTAALTRRFAVIGIGLSVVMASVVGIGRGDWIEGFLAGISLAMALLPEEFPVILATFLALGALRLSKIGVLARRGSAIESLGAATVLCVDKTGTLTVNRMAVAALSPEGETGVDASAPDIGRAALSVAAAAALACDRDTYDPMERAILDFAASRGAAPPTGAELIDEHERTATFLAMAHVWRLPDGTLVGAAKGAPETIADLCRLGAAAREAMAREVTALAERGLRVLGVALARRVASPEEARPGGDAYRYLGLVALADPVRDEVPTAIAACRAAGIRVVMVTGDHAITARAVAEAAGIRGGALTLGVDFARLDDAAKSEAAARTSVFARMLPDQKLDLVRALAARGEVVGMTGDGVNDAPALKAAHVGVAMGGRGSDVAREAASLVLLNDDFAALVRAIERGRRIGRNIRRAMAYVLSIHVPIAGLALLPPLFGLPLVLLPAHVVFLELVIDPIAALAFEAEQGTPDIMSRPPVAPDSPLIDASAAGLVVSLGLSILAAAGFWLMWGRWSGLDEASTRALAFAALVAGNVGLVLATRSWTRSWIATFRDRNPFLWGALGAVLAALGAVLAYPPLADLFRFALPPWTVLAAALATGFLSTMWFELWKITRRRG